MMDQLMRARIAAIVLFLSGLAVQMPGQTVLGSVNGTVRDPSGRAVPNAKVVVKSLDQNYQREVVSSGAGTYVVPNLQPGRYSLTVTSAGFKGYTVPDFR